MIGAEHREKVSWGLVGTAVVLLLGILFLYGWTWHRDPFALYLGLFITIGGVLAGVLQIVIRPKP